MTGSEEASSLQESNGAENRAATVVEELDRLRAENVNLKLYTLIAREASIQHQINSLQQQLQAIPAERQRMNEEAAAVRAHIETKYNINLRTHIIRPDDGVVVPRAVSPLG